MPTWRKMIDDLLGDVAPPDDWASMDYPTKLDWVCGMRGHAAFRKALRSSVIEPMNSARIDEEIVRCMAIIGLRAGALVSFNIEPVSAVPFAGGGSFVIRSYRSEHEPFLRPWTNGGVTSKPVYFVHGLLDEGECVITKSEYAAHQMSLAVGTAVNLCLGGDLVILGMSLDDDYLRDAILKQRRWIRDVFWVTNSSKHAAWARVAKVHRISARYESLWTGIAAAHLTHDESGELRMLCGGPKGACERAVRAVARVQQFSAEVERELARAGTRILADKKYPPRGFAMFKRQCEDLGYDIPPEVVADPRYAWAWTEGGDPHFADFAVGSDTPSFPPKRD
jgi:hypothetical protein